jgi:tetratricopeptide (TPR) repeat protein
VNRTAVVVASIAACAAAAAMAAAAQADTPPSAWDIARDPGERDRWALHQRIERLIHSPIDGSPEPLELRRDQELRLESARSLLEEADAAHSPDVRLRFDIGIVYEEIATLEGRSDLNPKVIAILSPALDAFPDHPGATEALDSLVYAYAKLDRPREELSTWRQYIPRLLDARARVGPLMNMGEAQMRLGQLDDALATLHEGLGLCETLPNSSGVNATYALTLWDIAVALDRSGDAHAAAQTAAKARGWSWSEAVSSGAIQLARTVTGWDVIQDDDDVFFVPEWEREWYLALGDSASADAAADPRDAAHFWSDAEHHWDQYVTRSAATGNADRWLPIARARLEHARRARSEAQRRAARLAPRDRASRDGGTTL